MRFEHAVADMLQRHVEIFGDTFFAGVQIQQLVGHLLRIQIEGPNPAHIVHRDQLAQKGCEALPESKVHSIIDRVLRNQIEFLDTFLSQPLRFRHNRFNRTAPLLASHERDRAEGTIPITAFGNFQIGAMRESQADARSLSVIQDKEARQAIIAVDGALGASRLRQISAMRPNSPVPTTPSSSGNSFKSSPWYRCARQPAAIRHPAGAGLLQRPCSMMLLIDSCLASSIKPQVLMMTTSAARASPVSWNPPATKVPSITSESTWFFEQPRFTKPIVGLTLERWFD